MSDTLYCYTTRRLEERLAFCLEPLPSPNTHECVPSCRGRTTKAQSIHPPALLPDRSIPSQTFKTHTTRQSNTTRQRNSFPLLPPVPSITAPTHHHPVLPVPAATRDRAMKMTKRKRKSRTKEEAARAGGWRRPVKGEEEGTYAFSFFSFLSFSLTAAAFFCNVLDGGVRWGIGGVCQGGKGSSGWSKAIGMSSQTHVPCSYLSGRR